ncbi:MAG TPA: alanine racemase, partial [Calditrichaeota bacterium]|nr:alanine racemase [Calditrichota bacterium]
CLKNELEITLTAEYQIDRLRQVCEKTGMRAKVHIKIDTGMNRIGFLYESFEETVPAIFNYPFLDVKGVYTHFSSADEDDPSYTLYQYDRFLHVKKTILEKTNKKPMFHAANSAAIMKYPQTYFDMVRPGVMLYGNPPGPDFKLSWPLKEVMRFVSQITLIKVLNPDEPVSYNRRFYTRKKTRVGVIPVGYADGYSRQLTNRGQVLIRGRRFPVIGTVCMDAIMVNLQNAKDIRVGDEVVLFGAQEKEQVTIVEMSRLQNTIPYEVTCRVSGRVPRVHIK